MTLILNVRDVAQANIDKFDQLGAFHGERKCEYHYIGGLCCAIGICDPDKQLSRANVRINEYVFDGKVETDDLEILTLIQDLHDFKASGLDAVQADDEGWNWDEVPECVGDVLAEVKTRNDLTPDIYKEVMRRIAAR